MAAGVAAVSVMAASIATAGVVAASGSAARAAERAPADAGWRDVAAPASPGSAWPGSSRKRGFGANPAANPAASADVVPNLGADASTAGANPGGSTLRIEHASRLARANAGLDADGNATRSGRANPGGGARAELGERVSVAASERIGASVRANEIASEGARLRDAADRIATSASPAAKSVRASAAACTPSWPRWDRFKRDFMSADGRVIDVGSADERTVSEGQAYGLFFALVANDRPAFDALLHWTEHNLAQGDLAAHLPAWLWGRAADGAWRVLDANAASDADLWITYALLEAGRLWRERSYTARGALLAKRVLDDETAMLPGLGLVLLPGPTGFRPMRDLWRLNPSYSPPQAIRGIGAHLPDDARWARLAASVGRVLIDSAPRGFAPDWALYRADRGFEPDADSRAESAYNAIRVYLWAGMLDASDALAQPLLARFAPFADHVAAHGAPPETVDATTGAAGPRDGNAGFSAAAVPFLDARGEHALADAQVARIARLEREAASGYYANVLTLFGLGWRDGRYRFAADGTLNVRWSEPCSTPAR